MKADKDCARQLMNSNPLMIELDVKEDSRLIPSREPLLSTGWDELQQMIYDGVEMILGETSTRPKGWQRATGWLAAASCCPDASGPVESSGSGLGLASETPVKPLPCRTIFLFPWGLSHPLFSAFTQLSGNGDFSFNYRYATRALCALRIRKHEETIAYAFKKSDPTWVNQQPVETRVSVQDKLAAMRMISVSRLLERCIGEIRAAPMRTSRSFRIEIRPEPPTTLEASVFACDIKRHPPSGRSAEISKDVRTSEPSQSST